MLQELHIITDDAAFQVMGKAFENVVYYLRAIKYSERSETDHSTRNVFTPGRFTGRIMYWYITMASHLSGAQG